MENQNNEVLKTDETPVEQTQNEGVQPTKKEKFVALYKKTCNIYERGEKAVGNFFVRMQYPLLLLAITVFAFLLRTYFFDIKTGDYNNFLSVWYSYIKENGGFLALGTPIPGADYSPAYYYLFALLTYLPLEPVHAIKLLSCLFDVFLAVGVTLCVWELTKNKKIAILGYAVVSFLPTVFLNSGAWGQCDAIYVSFAVLSLYFLLKKKHYTAMILYGVAFSFKLQAIFIAPLLAVLWFKRKIPRSSPFIILGVYFLSCVPMWMMGRNLLELLVVYFRQAGQYNDRLSLNAPTFLALVGNLSQGWVEGFSSSFVILAFGVTGMVMYIIGHTEIDKKENLVAFALLFALGVPYLLPHMHERYFYIADILSIIYFALNRKRWYTAVLTQICSFYVVAAYLLRPDWLSLSEIALVQALNIILLCRDLWKDYKAQKKSLALTDKGV